MMHHSQLSGARGGAAELTQPVLLSHQSGFADGVILGASSLEHLTENLASCKGGTLDTVVVEAFEEGWKRCAAVCPTYFR